MAKRIIYHKCPFCDDRYTRVDLVNHIDDNHEDMLPKDFTPFRYVFNYVNKKPVSYHGKCTECGGPTPWDENKGRYDRQCEKKSCRESYVKKFEENMMKTRGVTRITATEEGQLKMLANRKISGTYVFADGGKRTYCGSYEKNALEFMDKCLNIKSDDILTPGPILEYSFEGKTKIYITDFFYQPYNLIIEVKDGGDNPNKRNMPEYRAKQIAKEQFIIKHTNFNYLRLTNNNLSQLLSVFMDLKLQMVENTGERVIHVNESVDNPILEAMTMSGYAPIVGTFDRNSVYIVNYLQNNVFSGGEDEYADKFDFAITPSVLSDSIVYIDKKDNTLVRGSKKDIKIKNGKYYKINKSIEEATKLLYDYIGKQVPDYFIYETLTGEKLYLEYQPDITISETVTDDMFTAEHEASRIREAINNSMRKRWWNNE